MTASVVLFSGVDPSGQEGLWETNGTASGTIEIAELGGASNTPYNDFTSVNGVVLFAGENQLNPTLRLQRSPINSYVGPTLQSVLGTTGVYPV